MVAMIFGGREKNWALVMGSDHNNSDAGLTLLYGRKPPEECDEINEAWRHIWRLNVRWPITLRHRRPVAFPGRFRNHKAVQEMMQACLDAHDGRLEKKPAPFVHSGNPFTCSGCGAYNGQHMLGCPR